MKTLSKVLAGLALIGLTFFLQFKSEKATASEFPPITHWNTMSTPLLVTTNNWYLAGPAVFVESYNRSTMVITNGSASNITYSVEWSLDGTDWEFLIKTNTVNAGLSAATNWTFRSSYIRARIQGNLTGVVYLGGN